MSKRQSRAIFLCNDVLLYAAKPTNPGQGSKLTLKGRIWLRDGARIQALPSTEATPHAFAVVAGGGKGYTWLAESADECKEYALLSSHTHHASFTPHTSPVITHPLLCPPHLTAHGDTRQVGRCNQGRD